MVEEKKQPEAESADVEMEAADPEAEVEEEEEEAEDSSLYHLRILPLTHSLHQKHGLRHDDYQRYRGYCSRRLLRIRKAVKLVQGEKRKFVKKEVTAGSNYFKEEKCLHIPLITTERAWAYAMQLKFEMNTEPRKKYHMLSRLRKADQHAQALEQLVMESERCDARTKLEAQAYRAWIGGTLCFELQDWAQAMKLLTQARTIYDKLSSTLSEDEAALYKQRMADIVPSLRYCAYNSGDEVAKQELANISGGGRVEELVNQAREEQAATLQEVEWKGRKMAVKQEKVRLFLIREKEFADELAEEGADNYEGKIEAYESLLMDCKDGIQALRDDLLEEPSFRNRQQAKEGPVTSMHFLYTYLSYIKCSKTIDRNLAMTEHMKKCLDGKSSASSESKKPVRPQDLVRLYETIVQNLNEMPQLAGLEDDGDLRREVESKVVFFKAWRCNFLALAFLAAQKWSEAMALYQRATLYAKKAQKDTSLQADLRSQVDSLLSSIESRQFMAHANSILDADANADAAKKAEEKEKAAKKGAKNKEEKEKKKMLIERLDEYYEDPDLVKGKSSLVQFPPAFQPIPCKPLFFDLAVEQLEFPSLDAKIKAGAAAAGARGGGSDPSSPQKGGASGGWLGGWGWGGWGGAKK